VRIPSYVQGQVNSGNISLIHSCIARLCRNRESISSSSYGIAIEVSWNDIFARPNTSNDIFTRYLNAIEFINLRIMKNRIAFIMSLQWRIPENIIFGNNERYRWRKDFAVAHAAFCPRASAINRVRCLFRRRRRLMARLKLPWTYLDLFITLILKKRAYETKHFPFLAPGNQWERAFNNSPEKRRKTESQPSAFAVLTPNARCLLCRNYAEQLHSRAIELGASGDEYRQLASSAGRVYKPRNSRQAAQPRAPAANIRARHNPR
jgi:hypothetical protein